ncbi:hypothetical protein AYI70_g977 [Smittium culicis]|uniref:Uncharacterized protein n=1 Tax=Smittium culicis TaxID=133412 RepID=A0A1R1YEF5_9FUNG|nr:hypothetical protein AYI70_g977 [Smittium culicis]
MRVVYSSIILIIINLVYAKNNHDFNDITINDSYKISDSEQDVIDDILEDKNIIADVKNQFIKGDNLNQRLKEPSSKGAIKRSEIENIKESKSNKSSDVDDKIEIELDNKEDASDIKKKPSPTNFKFKEKKATNHLNIKKSSRS